MIGRVLVVLLIVAAFLLGWTAHALASSALGPAPVIPAAIVFGAGESDQGRTGAPHTPHSPDVPRSGGPASRRSSGDPLAPRTSITGIASWYATGPDGLDAAAGPALRRALGPGWRGRYVLVSSDLVSIRVELIDWCACSPTRVIDLSDEAFRTLGPLSGGLLRVEVSW